MDRYFIVMEYVHDMYWSNPYFWLSLVLVMGWVVSRYMRSETNSSTPPLMYSGGASSFQEIIDQLEGDQSYSDKCGRMIDKSAESLFREE